MAGAQVVIDLANSPSFEDKAVRDAVGQAPRGVRRGHERDGADDPGELRFNQGEARRSTIPRAGSETGR
jgi:hypothetical protein